MVKGRREARERRLLADPRRRGDRRSGRLRLEVKPRQPVDAGDEDRGLVQERRSGGTGQRGANRFAAGEGRSGTRLGPERGRG